jgi:arylsulfatase A-like enzyme
MKQQPNIIFFFTDDQRFDTIGACGYPFIKTPHMDRLLQSGTCFTQAHIPGGTVGAICMPSRAMLHTGKTLFHLEHAGEDIPADHTLLGETLQQSGYECFGTGKWHNGRSAYARSFTCGDDIFFGGMSDHWNVPAYHFDPTGAYDKAIPRVADPFRSNEVEYQPCDHISPGRHSSELFADAAIDFLNNRKGDTPYFAYISFMAPHDPRTMPEEYLKMYDPQNIELPPNFTGAHSFDNGALHIRDEELEGFPRDPEKVKRHIAEYYAMISHLDAQIGRVMDEVERRGETENTLFILAGDNGLAVGRHGLMGKQSMYEHSIRVPLVMSGPGIGKGAQSNAPVYLLDIYPSLCDYLGIDIPSSVEGQSFIDALRGKEFTGREVIFSVYASYQRAVKKDGYKYVLYRVDGKEYEQLFDLSHDPWEKNNLISDPAFASKRRDLNELLRSCANDWDDKESSWGREFWGASYT